MFTAVATLAMAALLFGPLASNEVPPREERSFAGTGSRGVATDIEVFLLEGTYGHRLTAECPAAASLFPGLRQPMAPLRDVLSADLTTSQRSIDTGRFSITQAGWVNLQVGTAPDCEWEYSVTGTFLPLGSEPPPARSPDDLGGIWGAGILVLVAGGIMAAVVRSRRRPAESSDDDAVKVWVGPPPD